MPRFSPGLTSPHLRGGHVLARQRHYFAAASDASAQLHYFACLMSWLLSLAGKSFDAPDQYDDPNTICSNIVTKLKELRLVESMSQSALRSVRQLLHDRGPFFTDFSALYHHYTTPQPTCDVLYL